MIDFSRISHSSSSNNLDPRDIYMSLPLKNKKYEYPRDVQSDVWRKWFPVRNSKNCIIKMNTGSGKTLVGLLILQSCLNDGKGSAVYVAPNNYLVNQVCLEAKALGLEVTTNETDMSYIMKKSILVISIKRLVNGKSVFGMRKDNNVKIGSIIIDDAHACIDDMKKQSTICIPREHKDYDVILSMFENSLKNQSGSKFSDIAERNENNVFMLVPYWEWQNRLQKVIDIIEKVDEDSIKFPYLLIRDSMHLCNCVISNKAIEISPICVPIHKISSFETASRRIFMSATLSDDSVFVTTLGLKTDDLKDIIITPDKAGDIGERLILFPQVMNSDITNDDIKEMLSNFSAKLNIVLIVPSNNRSNYWSDVGTIVQGDRISETVEKMKRGEHLGLVVFVNKYDGIDLPDDACRILVIDGLPETRSAYEAYEKSVSSNDRRICCDQISKIEQGMGRGVRSTNDYCVVLLLGRRLVDIIYSNEGMDFFSNATKKQYELSSQIWGLLKAPTIVDLNNLMKTVLYDRDKEWISLSKGVLLSVEYNAEPRVSNLSVALRSAYNSALFSLYNESTTYLNKECGSSLSKDVSGLVKQYIGFFTHFINQTKAQEVQLSAYKDNFALLKPLSGIRFGKVYDKIQPQVQNLINWINENHWNPQEYIRHTHGIIESLAFMPDSSDDFEAAIEQISMVIGIQSRRPEREIGAGPDNLWFLDNQDHLVIECKNETVCEEISKKDCAQLLSSNQWFEDTYNRDHLQKCTPVMIHKSRIFSYQSAPLQNIRIMTPDLLDKFNKSVLSFVSYIASPEVWGNMSLMSKALYDFRLQSSFIVSEYTSTFIHTIAKV